MLSIQRIVLAPTSAPHQVEGATRQGEGVGTVYRVKLSPRKCSRGASSKIRHFADFVLNVGRNQTRLGLLHVFKFTYGYVPSAACNVKSVISGRQLTRNGTGQTPKPRFV